MLCKIWVLGTRFFLKRKIYKIFFKKLHLRQQNTVTTERQEISEVNLMIAPVYCVLKESRIWGTERETKWRSANSMSWGDKGNQFSGESIGKQRDIQGENSSYLQRVPLKYSVKYCSMHEYEELGQRKSYPKGLKGTGHVAHIRPKNCVFSQQPDWNFS